MDLQRKAIAEVLDTLWLVLGGCGSAVLAGIFLRRGRQYGDRLPRCGTGLRAHRPDRRVRARPHLGRPLQPRGHPGSAGDWADEQLWLFWLAPLVGGGLAGLVHRYVIEERPQTRTGHG